MVVSAIEKEIENTNALMFSILFRSKIFSWLIQQKSDSKLFLTLQKIQAIISF